MKNIKLFTFLTLIFFSLNACVDNKENKPKNESLKLDNEKVADKDVVNEESNNQTTNFLDDPSYCENDVFKATNRNANGYDSDKNYVLSFNLPIGEVEIQGQKSKIELKKVDSFQIQVGEQPIIMEVWQHGLDYDKPLCSQKTKVVTTKGKLEEISETNRKNGIVVIYHDEKWNGYSPENRDTIIEDIKKEIKPYNGIAPISKEQVIGILQTILKPQTIGGGVIPPRP